MRPVPACYTSGRSASNFLGPGRCTISCVGLVFLVVNNFTYTTGAPEVHTDSKIIVIVCHTHIHTHARIHSHTHARTHICTHTYAHTHTHTHARTHARMRAHAHAHTHTRTHTHAHTHTQSKQLEFVFC